MNNLLQLNPKYYLERKNQELPDAETVFAEVSKRMNKLQLATAVDKALTIGAWNMEYLNKAKALYFSKTYSEIIKRHHLLAVEEVSEEGIATLAKSSHYNHYCAKANSRGQAVGFLLHPRLEVMKQTEYTQVADIFNIADLRPALRLDLYDKESNVQFSIIAVHLKSMCGGIKMTGVVRRHQLTKLMQLVEEEEKFVCILGDFNCFLDQTSDTNSLVNAGYVLANPRNHTATHQFGGRLDGLFYKNKPATVKLSSYNIRNFWRNTLIGCWLSDHGLLSWKMTLKAKELEESYNK